MPSSINWILNLATLESQQETLAEEVGELLENEAFGFVSECESIPNQAQRETFLKTVFAHLTKLNIRRTLHRFEVLRPSDQIAVVESIYENVKTQDENYAIQSLPMYSWEIQEIALVAFLSEPRRNTMEELVAIAEIVPAMVVPLLAEIENRDKLRDISERLIRNWAIKEHPIAITLIKELHESMPIEWLLIHTTIALSHSHPVEAFRLTHAYHRELGFVFESEVLHHIAQNHPETALDLLDNVRRVYFSVPSRNNLSTTIFRLDPEYAVEFGNALNERESNSFFRTLRLNYCKSPPEVLIHAIGNIPFAETVSRTTRCLLFETRRNEKLTETQFNVLYAHLLPKDKSSIDEHLLSSFIREDSN